MLLTINKGVYLPLIAFLTLSFFYCPSVFSTDKIVRSCHSEPESIDPHKVQSIPAMNIVNDLFEGLVSLDNHNNVIPAQAERWDISKDRKVYTFYLRPNSQWSDGSPLTANDFVFSWKRAINPKTLSPYAWYPKMAGIKNIRALNENTLEITLTHATPWFLQLLVHPIFFPVPSHVVKKYGSNWTDSNNIVSNGAYTLSNRIVNSKIVLKKNSLYRDSKNVNIPLVEWLPISSHTSAVHLFETNALDITSGIPADGFDSLKNKYADQLVTLKQAGTEYLVFNTRKAPMNNKSLRQALSYAIDRQAIVTHILRQGQISAWQFTPYYMKDAPHHNPHYETLSLAERVALAKQRYHDAGYSKEHPLTISLLYNDDETRKKLMIVIAHMWKSVLGVNVKIENQEWKTLLDRLQQGNFEVARASWVADYNEASSMLGHFSKQQLNKAGYDNPRFDQLYSKSKNLNRKQRIETYVKLEDILAEDMPIAPLYFFVSPRLVQERVKGYYASPVDQIYTRYLRLE